MRPRRARIEVVMGNPFSKVKDAVKGAVGELDERLDAMKAQVKLAIEVELNEALAKHFLVVLAGLKPGDGRYRAALGELEDR